MENIVTHINSNEVQKHVESIAKQLNIAELRIDNFEEFLHTLVHINPKMFIVEIEDKSNAYIKIIRIVKKSILTRDIPFIAIVTSRNQELIKEIATLDIQGIIYPPILKEVMHLSIQNIIQSIGCKETMQMIQDLQMVQSVMISGLASLAEYRDPETGEHIKRTQNYVKALATTLRRKGQFAEELTLENIEAMYMSVPLHDIGKVGIRDDILLKPGRLTEAEFEVMKTHTTLGYESIMSVGNQLKNSAFLEYAADVAYTHHEKYDGSGYPRGLQGEDIPLIGRLMAVADVYDALTNKRVYKEAMSHEEAMNIIVEGKGKHFDPQIVDCAVSLESTFQNILHTYKDASTTTDNYIQLTDLYKDNLLSSVLVVEDSRIVREITRNQLEAIGLKVDTAVNGQEGYKKIKKTKYDLVILDIEMPKMNGYEMATRVMKLEEVPIIIAMTAADFNVTTSELNKVGISGLVPKPVDFNRLSTVFTEALKSKNHLFVDECE